MLYFITYDLRKPGQNYQALYDALKSIGARRALESVWAVKRFNTNPSGLRDYLRTFTDANDRLLVIESANWSSWNAMFDINTL